ncbi:MAG TPA: DinB family protein [Puia sp.]|nr:DinB family protein [Puia sp.]
MNIIVTFFEKQLKEEAEITRKMLKIVPEDKYDWQPHPKSMTVRRLATHIAELPGWIPMAIDTDVLDFSANDYKPTPISNNSELLATFEENQQKAEKALPKTTDEYLLNIWTMKDGDQIFLSITKQDVIRMALSQTIHHRAQLGVFLRLLNIPIPGSYGPSADEMGL